MKNMGCADLFCMHKMQTLSILSLNLYLEDSMENEVLDKLPFLVSLLFLGQHLDFLLQDSPLELCWITNNSDTINTRAEGPQDRSPSLKQALLMTAQNHSTWT